MPHRPSKSELRARDRLLYNLYYLQRDDFIDITLRDQVPEAWHTLELDVECSKPKEKSRSIWIARWCGCFAPWAAAIKGASTGCCRPGRK
jgi:hypothetical protein